MHSDSRGWVRQLSGTMTHTKTTDLAKEEAYSGSWFQSMMCDPTAGPVVAQSDKCVRLGHKIGGRDQGTTMPFKKTSPRTEDFLPNPIA